MSNYKTINISLPEDLLKKVDEEARSEFANRSDFIRDTLVRRLKHQKVIDEWGDEGEWETIVNFKSIDSSGIKIEDAIKALGQLTK
ncbi:MAG TPA: ribbon-helix-helix domain-containing protein [Candidatus Saccharimonadales bacterium]|nr:ribbon-helix-helix domain-containing protein [Candidatus Saccharimonadales bacterium]